MTMTASHHGGRHRQSRRLTIGRRIGAASFVGVASAAALLGTAHDAQPRPVPDPVAPAVAGPGHSTTPQHIEKTGQVIAASKDSLTTSTPDGQTTTFRITADTAQISAPGTGTPDARTALPLKRKVVVLGIVHDGVAVATAIADAAVGPHGPPMDYGLPT